MRSPPASSWSAGNVRQMRSGHHAPGLHRHAQGRVAPPRLPNCSAGTSPPWTSRRRRSGRGWRYTPATRRCPMMRVRRVGSGDADALLTVHQAAVSPQSGFRSFIRCPMPHEVNEDGAASRVQATSSPLLQAPAPWMSADRFERGVGSVRRSVTSASIICSSSDRDTRYPQRLPGFRSTPLLREQHPAVIPWPGRGIGHRHRGAHAAEVEGKGHTLPVQFRRL